ncbi:response regulator [Fusibacter tunisiensis]|uniref:Stage 0 sporulation protein A homolog n=1 Tax=Fusibacter tunisiensis TaxID=1008308 RepID=A0ABS2MSD4_9FIRM|nr:response regulator [Fusibacter tunisiensis]MBM7562270.1 CheY-like chemotaxis protein [Fusibacter tunisiensis]
MKILHFEYSVFFRRVIHDMITNQGHDYTGTDTIDSLKKLLVENQYDVIFTGMELTDGSAEELLEKLKHLAHPKIPVVIITSSEVKDVTHRLKNLDFSDFILKENLTKDTLNRCLRRL